MQIKSKRSQHRPMAIGSRSTVLGFPIMQEMHNFLVDRDCRPRPVQWTTMKPLMDMSRSWTISEMGEPHAWAWA